MTESLRCVGFNLTASRLQFVETEKVSDQFNVLSYGQTFITPTIAIDAFSEINLHTYLQSAFEEIKIRNTISCNSASFSLPPELFIIIHLPYDKNLTQNEIRDEFIWEVSQLYPFVAIENLAMKFYELGSGFLTGRNDALIVGLNKKFLVQIKNFCLQNNLIPKLIDCASISANSFININYSDNQSTNIHLYNSRNTVTLFVNISSKPAYVKVLKKSSYVAFKPVIDELSDLKFNKLKNDYSLSAIISGDELSDELLSELQETTCISFKQFNPFDFIRVNSEVQKNEIESGSLSSFTSAVGIASRFNS